MPDVDAVRARLPRNLNPVLLYALIRFTLAEHGSMVPLSVRSTCCTSLHMDLQYMVLFWVVKTPETFNM